MLGARIGLRGPPPRRHIPGEPRRKRDRPRRRLPVPGEFYETSTSDRRTPAVDRRSTQDPRPVRGPVARRVPRFERADVALRGGSAELVRQHHRGACGMGRDFHRGAQQPSSGRAPLHKARFTRSRALIRASCQSRPRTRAFRRAPRPPWRYLCQSPLSSLSNTCMRSALPRHARRRVDGAPGRSSLWTSRSVEITPPAVG